VDFASISRKNEKYAKSIDFFKIIGYNKTASVFYLHIRRSEI
jgi:hypothetical protein